MNSLLDSLQSSLRELTSNFDELEIAYDTLLNRDEFILDLLNASSIKEVRIKELIQDNNRLKQQINESYEAYRKLKSRTLWERICNK